MNLQKKNSVYISFFFNSNFLFQFELDERKNHDIYRLQVIPEVEQSNLFDEFVNHH